MVPTTLRLQLPILTGITIGSPNSPGHRFTRLLRDTCTIDARFFVFVSDMLWCLHAMTWSCYGCCHGLSCVLSLLITTVDAAVPACSRAAAHRLIAQPTARLARPAKTQRIHAASQIAPQCPARGGRDWLDTPPRLQTGGARSMCLHAPRRSAPSPYQSLLFSHPPTTFPPPTHIHTCCPSCDTK